MQAKSSSCSPGWRVSLYAVLVPRWRLGAVRSGMVRVRGPLVPSLWILGHLPAVFPSLLAFRLARAALLGRSTRLLRLGIRRPRHFLPRPGYGGLHHLGLGEVHDMHLGVHQDDLES